MPSLTRFFRSLDDLMVELKRHDWSSSPMTPSVERVRGTRQTMYRFRGASGHPSIQQIAYVIATTNNKAVARRLLSAYEKELWNAVEQKNLAAV